MSRRGARLAVAVLFALAAAAAAWEYVQMERTGEAARLSAAAFDREARALAAAVVDLRASQQAYVAVGQGTDFWTARVSTSLASLKSRAAALRARAGSPDAALRLESATAAIDDFARMDLRAREYARSNQRLLASDLIFADGFEMTQALIGELDASREAERLSSGRTAAQARTRQHALAGGVAGLGLFFLLLLGFSPAARAAPERSEMPAAELPAESSPEPLALILDETPPPPAVDLTRAADLCLALARVKDTQEIPALLDRAARLLDAQGIVLWMADPDGRELVPTVTHGYAPAAVSRLWSIPRDADNATAAAFREATVQTVRGDALSNGAIVAPLITPGGCVGVMAAEVRHERERQEPVRAVAAIIAAQLATLIGVTPSQVKRAAGAE
jgi:hypothetical protein